MNLKIFLAGITLVFAGLFLFGFGPALFALSQLEFEEVVLLPRSTLLVGDMYELSRGVDEKGLIVGWVEVRLPSSNESGTIDFYVADEANFHKWLRGEKASLIYERRGGEAFNFTLAVQPGTYYVILDNRYSIHKKEVTIALYLRKESEVRLPDMRIANLGLAGLGIGALVAVYGALKRQPIPWA